MVSRFFQPVIALKDVEEVTDHTTKKITGRMSKIPLNNIT